MRAYCPAAKEYPLGFVVVKVSSLSFHQWMPVIAMLVALSGIVCSVGMMVMIGVAAGHAA